jgi:phosphatidylserine/phosphatidylglycerophosphate/cardiolipin synthase-like enzyme
MALADFYLSPEERENPWTRIDAIRDGARAWSIGNHVRPIVHGAEYFAELAEGVRAMGDGDRVYFVDWRGDPDEQLDDSGETLLDVLTKALGRGVDVRGLLWRSHWRKLGFHSQKAFALGKALEKAGGECLRDMRVRTGGAHHQKFVILRHRDDHSRDIAFVGGIDLCHSRRDSVEHLGDPQPLEIAVEYGPRPAWHDVQVAIRGPAVHDVETTFRERWEDSTPLTLNPGRRFTSWLQAEDQDPDPLGEQWPPPPEVKDGHEAVQVVRTYPPILPTGYDFAPQGERSIALGNAKAIAHARKLIYVEDQYLWGEEVGEHFATVLRANPELRLIIVLPVLPDVEAGIGRTTQLHARLLAIETILEAGGDRVALFGLNNSVGLPIYVHSKVCIIDDRWASVGSDNLNRRSWSSDSEIACAIMDQRLEDVGPDEPAPKDAFALRLRRRLCAEHLGIAEDEVPDDPHELFDLMRASATALDEWYAASALPDPSGVGRVVAKVHARHRRLPRSVARGRERVADEAAKWLERAGAKADRPVGQLRRLELPDLSPRERWLAGKLYAVVDPDGTVGRREDLGEISQPTPAR